MIFCNAPFPAKKRFYHLSRFHTRVSLTWLHFPCVCRSQIVREHLVRKRPDGHAGKCPAPEEIMSSTYLHSFKALENESPDRQWHKKGFLQVSSDLQEPGPDEHFCSLGSRKFKFSCCKFTWWYLIPPSLCSENELSPLLESRSPSHRGSQCNFHSPYPVEDKVKYWGHRHG